MTISLITVCGGVLGVLFMIPLRNSIIVQEHGVLPYPEAQACAEVLLAGENDSNGSSAIFAGIGLSAVLKFIIDGLKLVPGAIAVPLKYLKTEFSTEIYPAVTAVGYICGFRISSYLFAGGLLAWFVLIPAIVLFGGESILFPVDCTVAELYEAGGAGAIGIYLPLELTAAIMVGGVVRHIMDKKYKSSESESSSGVLFSSGLIAGKGIIGILLAVLTVCGIADKIDLSRFVPAPVGTAGALILFAGLIALIVKFAVPKKNK